MTINVNVLVAGSGSVPGSILLTVTDPTGVVPAQTQTVNGTEATPFQANFQGVADSGAVSAQSLDASGNNLGSPITQNYGATGTGTGSTFSTLSGITVTQA